MPTDKTFSFREALSGELIEFLNDEHISWAEAIPMLVALASDLVHYKEEGLDLSPEIYICFDISKLISQLPLAHAVEIGKGPRGALTAQKALKECAPLARGAWAIYIERKGKSLVYGVFRAADSPLALTPYEVLIEAGEKSVPVLVVTKLAENCIEVRGSNGNRRCIHFSAVRVGERPSPKGELSKLSEAITRDMEENGKEQIFLKKQTFRFTYNTLSYILQEPHGVLAVVLSPGSKKLPDSLSDAIVLKEPIVLSERVSNFTAQNDIQAMADLQGTASLMNGFLHSDGITVFRSDSAILGYRAFLSSPKKFSKKDRPSGGARRRTYEELKSLVGKNIIAAFFRSQDGHTEIT